MLLLRLGRNILLMYIIMTIFQRLEAKGTAISNRLLAGRTFRATLLIRTENPRSFHLTTRLTM